jgi:hypothetical protein
MRSASGLEDWGLKRVSPARKGGDDPLAYPPVPLLRDKSFRWGKPNSFVTRCHLESNWLNYQDKYQATSAIAIIPQNGTQRSACI